MEKSWTVGLVFVLAAVLFELATSDEALRPCLSNAECGPGRCCLDPTMRRGKRQTAGYCRDRGAVGASCYVREYCPEPAVHIDACPCDEGLECQGSGLYEVPQGETGTCVESKPTPCTTSADCECDECCVSNIRPIGKRRRRQTLSTSDSQPGTCQKLGKSGDSCYQNINTVQDIGYGCPCAKGYTCQGPFYYDIPIGYVGSCRQALTKG